MQNIILSSVAISDLVELLANEMDRRAALRSPSIRTLQSPSISTIQSSEKIRLYGDKAGARHIGCTPLTMGKLRKDGKVRFYSLGTRYYYYAHELDEDLRGGNHRFGELRGKRKEARKAKPSGYPARSQLGN